MNYLVVVRNNILMALPLQWLIVGPLARKILGMYQNRQFETA